MSETPITQWLRDIGLGQYVEAFVENDIDFDVLADLSNGDLAEIGLTLGHRKRLLRAIRELDAGTGRIATSPPPDEQSGEAERRRMTIMFSDLVGSTRLAAALDPEDMNDLMASYQQCCYEVIERWGGYVARQIGDGVLIYFGYPQAREDDAERAVRAALELAESLGEVKTRHPEPLACRIGIATGLAMVGDVVGQGADAHHNVVGATPNLAARLQTSANPGCVVISEGTRRLIGNMFRLEDLGALELKGFGERLQAWRVIDELPMTSRFEAVRGAGTTPLTGRRQEIDRLVECWNQAKRGAGHVVLLSGEPGIGKSRIVESLYERLQDEPHWWLRYQCSPYHVNSALFPVISHLEMAAGFLPADTAETKKRKLAALIEKSTADVPQSLALLSDLMSIGEASTDLTPEARRERTQQALLAVMNGLVASRPVLMVLEDAHWIDHSTDELLALVHQRMAQQPFLALVTTRPGYELPRECADRSTRLDLNRLGKRQSASMVRRLCGDKPLPAEIVEQIVARTDGVPLFIEELTKTILDTGLLADVRHPGAGGDRRPMLEVPETLHDSLMARLDSLAPVKGLAQIASVIGREFSAELLAPVARYPDERLERALGELIDAGLIFRRGSGSGTVYSFKHALVRDTAYDSLLRSRRERLHKRIAETLESSFADRLEAQPELMAHHLTEAGDSAGAIGWWYRAGEKAMGRSANHEAIGHLQRGLALIDALPPASERDREELRFQIGLGRASLATKGYAAPDVERAYGRAREICASLGDSPQHHKVVMGLEAYYFGRADMQTAYELAQQGCEIAERGEDPIQLLNSYHVLGMALFHQGALVRAVEYLDKAMAIYDRKHQDLPQLSRRIQNPGVGCRSYKSLALWHLGRAEQANRMFNEAVELARESAQPFSLAYALCFGAWFQQYRREPARTRELADEAIELSGRQKFSFWHAIARCYLGWSDVLRGRGEDGLAMLREGIELYETTGARISRPHWESLHADACLVAGEARACEAIVSRSLDAVRRSKERFCEPELHRLNGEYLERLGPENAEAAERCYRQAIDTARGQGARMLELRAATDLGRLWRETGAAGHRVDELLSPIIDGFSEGFDEYDLRRARELLRA